MHVAQDTVVLFQYDIHDKNGDLLESSADSKPTAYLHGYGNILPGLEKAMRGHQAGDTVTASLFPAEAYGARHEDAVQRIPIKHLSGAKRWKAGMVANVNTDRGRRLMTVIKVGHKFADMDTNHPLAGKTLTFTIKVVAVRAATAEEIAHGHAHGDGGHHH